MGLGISVFKTRVVFSGRGGIVGEGVNAVKERATCIAAERAWVYAQAARVNVGEEEDGHCSRD